MPWCYGGLDSRPEPTADVPAARAAGYRFVGIDRPGYGSPTPQPGRTIAGWCPAPWPCSTRPPSGASQVHRTASFVTGPRVEVVEGSARLGIVGRIVPVLCELDERW